MKVRELLKELSQVDPELEVIVEGEVSELSNTILNVGIDQEESGDKMFLIITNESN